MIDRVAISILTVIIVASMLILSLSVYEEIEPDCDVIEYRWHQFGMIQVSEWNTCKMKFSRPIPQCRSQKYRNGIN